MLVVISRGCPRSANIHVSFFLLGILQRALQCGVLCSEEMMCPLSLLCFCLGRLGPHSAPLGSCLRLRSQRGAPAGAWRARCAPVTWH